MTPMASQITGVSIVCSTVCSGTDKRKDESHASLAFVRGIHRWLVDSPHKGPATRKMFQSMTSSWISNISGCIGFFEQILLLLCKPDRQADEYYAKESIFGCIIVELHHTIRQSCGHINWHVIMQRNLHDDITNVAGTHLLLTKPKTIVCSTVYSGADQRKYQSSASLAFVWGESNGHQWNPFTKGQ